MERTEIIKALEWLEWLKSNTRYSDEAEIELTLSLIKELTEQYESMAKSVNEASDLIRKLRAEKKELTEGIKARDDTISRFIETMPLVKADTVRKMQNELKKTFSALCKGEMDDLFRIIDQIAKEMIGEGNG